MTTKDPGGWRQRWVATTFAMLAITEESAGLILTLTLPIQLLDNRYRKAVNDDPST